MAVAAHIDWLETLISPRVIVFMWDTRLHAGPLLSFGGDWFHAGAICFRQGRCFVGERCLTDIDDCSGVICERGGVCRDELNDYHCECPTGYTGKRL